MTEQDGAAFPLWTRWGGSQWSALKARFFKATTLLKKTLPATENMAINVIVTFLLVGFHLC